MTKKKFLRTWYSGMGLATLVVAVVAALLLAIIATARSILKNATHALGVAKEIVTNTQPIWALDTTNTVAAKLLEGAQARLGFGSPSIASTEKPRRAKRRANVAERVVFPEPPLPEIESFIKFILLNCYSCTGPIVRLA